MGHSDDTHVETCCTFWQLSQSVKRRKTNPSFLSLLHLLKLKALVNATADTFPWLVTTHPAKCWPRPLRLQSFCSFHVHNNKMCLTQSPHPLFLLNLYHSFTLSPTLPHSPTLFLTLIHSVMLQFTRFQSVSGGMQATPTPAALEQVQPCGEQSGGRRLLRRRKNTNTCDEEYSFVFVLGKVKV